MRKIVFVIGILSAATAHASVLVSLSSPTNLSTLTVSQTFIVDVTISGLPSPNTNDFIFNLDTQVLFPSGLLTPVPDSGNSSGLTPGPALNPNAVQGPLQAANFNAQSEFVTGSAVGDFSESPNASSGAIGLNGLYYSFLLEAAAAGSGNISFSSAAGANQYAANETGFNFAPLPTGSALPFTITPAQSVPEPSMLAVFGVLAAGALVRFGRR